MKYNIGFLLLSALFSQVCWAENISREHTDLVIDALQQSLTTDNYWFSKWSISERRNLRIVPLDNYKYLIAIQVLTKDKIKNGQSIQYQVAIINLNGFSPVVSYPRITYTLNDLNKDCENQNLPLLFDNIVTTEKVKQLMDTAKCFQTIFSIVDKSREYTHDKEWGLMISSLETQLLKEVDSVVANECIILFHDLILTDEVIYGVVFTGNGKKIIDIRGQILKTHSQINKYYCSLRFNPMGQLDVEWLTKLLRKPLIWHLKLSENKKLIIQRVSGWQLDYK